MLTASIPEVSIERTKRFFRLAPLILLLGTSGCYTFTVLHSELPSSPPEEDSKLKVRVTRIDGERVTLKNPWLGRDAVGGEVRAERVIIPLAEVERIEEAELDRDQTMRVALVVVGSALGILGLEWSGVRF
jgi:hypothetical protein